MNSPRVLLVDDDAALLQALPQALALRLPEVQVETSDSAVSALSLIQRNDYDAIITDVKMPGMDGLALLTRIKEWRPETPTLLITGHGEHDLTLQALRGGAYDFIQKPIDREYFIVALRRAIQTYQMRSQIREQQRALEVYAQSLEAQVQERTHELMEANAAKDVFLSMASHELKTPLVTLKGMVQLVRRRQGSAQTFQPAELASMERAINRMEILINDLLNTSLLESGVFALHPRRCDLVTLCQHIMEEHTSGTTLNVTFSAPAEPVEVEVDVDRISQALLNLLSNARKYSSQGAPITMRLRHLDDTCIVEVQDQGVGIPPEQLQYIFERFYQVPGIEKQSGSSVGLGLGLYITQKIVAQHNGRIEVESRPGHGSTFSIILPLADKLPLSNQDTTTAVEA
ncbi:MAG: hybrid sensor histidine kinase/response regulator [Chloroflexota bacterium]|nr:hybrid sensor histidine kinase/response regulator [Chloroflexota bacterium]